MKTFKIFVVLALTALFAACSTSPNNNDKPFHPHYNSTWYVKSPTYAQYVGMNHQVTQKASLRPFVVSAARNTKANTNPDTILITRGDKYNLHLNADTLQAKGKPNDVQMIISIVPIRAKYNFDFGIVFQWMLDSDSPYFINRAERQTKFTSVDITHRCTQQSATVDTVQFNVKPKKDSVAAVILIPVNGLTKTIDEMTNC